ncbi:MAG TPA: DUF1801 domain-containing protein [bacterium]|jgi:uncharacterized protein YdhG (YjbR/CyaY superfamily)
MKYDVETVKEYLEALPDDRRKQIEKVRSVIKKNMPKGYEETFAYGMIGWVVPLKLYPQGYLRDPNTPLPYVSVANQKNHMAVYLMSIYGIPEMTKWFTEEYKKTGKKMDMGKSCVRFRKIEDLPLDLIGEAVSRMSVKDTIEMYDKYQSARKSRKAKKK